MRDEWRWVAADGFEYSGSGERLRASLSSGELPPETPVWRDGFDIWHRADAVPELAEALANRPFAPAPPPALKTPAPVGISADQVVVGPPGQPITAVAPPVAPVYLAPAPPARKRSSLVWVLVGLVAVFGVLAVIGAGFLLLRGSAPTESVVAVGAPAASVSATVPAVTQEPAITRCQPTRKQKLFDAIHAKVPLIVSRAPDATALTVGFAETRLIANALVVDAETLALRSKKNERARAPIVGVVPIVKDGGVSLAIDVEDPRIRFGRTIDGSSQFRIGIGADGFVRQRENGPIASLWKADAKAESTVARVDGSPDLGLFVTVRRGGLAGSLFGGWLSADGSSRSELAQVAVTGAQVGTPTAAVGAGSVVMAAAVRASDDASWDVHLGKASSPKLPERLSALSLARASDDVQRMSPAIAALPGGRWLLQWTERESDQTRYVVRVAVLDADLRAAGDPITVSPPEADSGQGELWVRGDRAVSLHLVKTTSGHELMATRLECQ